MKNTRVITITGGLRGLGLALAQEGVRRGDTLLLTYKQWTIQHEHALASLQKQGHASAWPLDIRSPSSIDDFFSAISSVHPRLDVWISNAGVGQRALLSNTEWEDYEDIYAVNWRGTKHCLRKACDVMKPFGSGMVLAISSHQAFYGLAGGAAYSMSKAAIVGYAQALAHEVGGYGIAVNSVCPGFMETDMTRDVSEEQKLRVRNDSTFKSIQDLSCVAHSLYDLTYQTHISGQVFYLDSRPSGHYAWTKGR